MPRGLDNLVRWGRTSYVNLVVHYLLGGQAVPVLPFLFLVVAAVAVQQSAPRHVAV